MVELALFTLMLVFFIFFLSVAIFAWELGEKYLISENFGKRLNPFERWIDGLRRLLKL